MSSARWSLDNFFLVLHNLGQKHQIERVKFQNLILANPLEACRRQVLKNMKFLETYLMILGILWHQEESRFERTQPRDSVPVFLLYIV